MPGTPGHRSRCQSIGESEGKSHEYEGKVGGSSADRSREQAQAEGMEGGQSGMIIPVVDSKPDGRKKGLRMKIEHISVNENGEIESMFIKYSTCKSTGAMVLYPDNRNHYFIYTPSRGGCSPAEKE